MSSTSASALTSVKSKAPIFKHQQAEGCGTPKLTVAEVMLCCHIM